MKERIEAIRVILGARKFPCETEAGLQNLIATALAGFGFEREVVLARRERVDFMDASGIVLETKVKRIGKMPLLRQLVRYARHKRVKAIIVISLFPVDVPVTIGGKPLHVVELWRSGI